MNSGLTSVTFRQLGFAEIIELVKEAGLDGIEWGGDIHVPADKPDIALAVGEKTINAGLKVLSYGSYFRTGECGNAKEAFLPVLNAAVSLKAPVIRVWAGNMGSDTCDSAYFKKVVKDTRIICDMAGEKDITVCYEYHRLTLTDTYISTLRLIKETDRSNLKTYWQPNPDITYEENFAALQAILPYLATIHVFHWTGTNIRHELASGKNEWQRYIDIIKNDGKCHSLILEFVKDDKPEQFTKDAKTLLKLIK